jgi:hypothetical protein
MISNGYIIDIFQIGRYQEEKSIFLSFLVPQAEPQYIVEVVNSHVEGSDYMGYTQL